MPTFAPHISDYVTLTFSNIVSPSGDTTDIINFSNEEILTDITVPTKVETQIFKTAAGVNTSMASPLLKSNNIVVKTAKPETIAKLHRIERYLLTGGYKCRLDINHFYDVMTFFEWATPPPHPTVYPGVGDSAYINGIGPITVGIAHISIWQSKHKGGKLPYFYNCIIDMGVQSFREQVRGTGMRADGDLYFIHALFRQANHAAPVNMPADRRIPNNLIHGNDGLLCHLAIEYPARLLP